MDEESPRVDTGSIVKATIRFLQSLLEAGAVAGLSDGQLLDHFITHGEEAALEQLVVRHGPMVWGVCCRLLHDHHDAEDAFQATFLVLARKAASIVPREKVGNWLYGVAYQTARKARTTRAKRRVREVHVPDAPEPVAMPEAPRHELAECLDQELSRLPDKYRTPIVLCELEGKSHGEAAERLGWPIGTVSGRLSRGRALLAKRMTRRSGAAAGGSLAVVLAQSQSTASASLPAGLLSSTVKAASLYAAGKTVPAGLVSTEVVALTQEVLRAMLLSKIKIAAAVMLSLVMAGAGVWQAKTWAGGSDDTSRAAAKEGGTARAVANEGTFRVTVSEVVQEDSAIVTQVDLEIPRGAKLELFNDRDRGAGAGSSLTPDPGDGLAHIKMIIFADLVEWKAGGTNIVKFMTSWKLGGISNSTSREDPIPIGDKKLSDLVQVLIKSGDYEMGQVTKLVSFNSNTYNFVVHKPK